MSEPVRSRFETWSPLAAGILLAIPVLVARYPPMSDLPLHEAVIGILRHFDDGSMYPPGLYLRNLGEPNQLFHLLAWALSYVVSTDLACKIVIAGAVVAIPVCAARAAEQMGANRIAALIVAPMALGWLFMWGLVANMIGLAALLVTVPLLDRLAQAPTPRRALASVGAIVLLYFAHEAMMIVAAGAAVLFAAAHVAAERSKPRPEARAIRDTALRAVPFVAGFAIAVAQAQYQKRVMTAVVASIRTSWAPLTTKIVRIPYLICATHDVTVRTLFFSLFVLAIVGLFVLRSRERRGKPIPRDALTLFVRYRFELFSLLCFVAYLAFPATLNGATLVYQRFFPPALAMLVVIAAPRGLAQPGGRLVRVLAVSLPVAMLLLTWPSFADADRVYRSLDAIIPSIEKGSALAEVSIGGDPTRDFAPATAAARIVAVRGGRVLYDNTNSTVAPVIVAPAYRWNEVTSRTAFDCWKFRPGADFHLFRYLAFRSPSGLDAALATDALAPYARPIAWSGEWILFESRLPVAPLLSREEPLPKPPPLTLHTLMKRVIDELRRTQPELPPLPETEEDREDSGS